VLSTELNTIYYPAQNMPIFVYKLIVVLNGYAIALIQLGQYVYRTEKIKFYTIFNTGCRGFVLTRSDKCFRSLLPVAVQLLSPPKKRHTKQKNNFFSSLIVNHLFLSNQEVEKGLFLFLPLC
jgi:hypothetical protein